MVVAETNTRRAFTADEVRRMIDSGVIQPDEHVELIEGELVVVTPQGPTHASLTVLVRAALERVYGRSHHVRDHSPVEGTRDSIPEPDLAVVRGDPRAFLSRMPGPAEVDLVVEVAHTSLAVDRRKADVYATVGYAAYWLIDVVARRVEVRTAPRDGVYTKTEITADGAELVAPGAGGVVQVAELLP